MSESTWRSFLHTADEWFVAYALIPVGVSLPSVTMFSVGHTVELYLKAVYARHIGSVDDAIGYGHNIKGLWDACKTHDRNFMPDYEIRDEVYEVYTLERGERFEERFSEDDWESYRKLPELYLVAKYLPDLRYFWSPFRSIEGEYAMSSMHPNPSWIEFFRELRRYLGHPSPGELDFIRHQIDAGSLPDSARRYLERLYA
jgi:hypothetical protein